MFAALAEKYPVFADPEKVRKLSRWWIINVLLPPRNEDGQIEGLPKKKKKQRRTDEELYFEGKRKKGYPEWRIEEKWAEIQENIRKGREEADKLRDAMLAQNQAACAIPVGIDSAALESGEYTMREEDEDKPKKKPKRVRDSRGWVAYES